MKLRTKLQNGWKSLKNIIASPKLTFVLKSILFLLAVVIGIPMIWISIPTPYRPTDFWDFFNSTLLCYVAWNVTIKRVGCWIKN